MTYSLKLSSSPHPYYASHYLRVGGYLTRWMAVQSLPSGALDVRPFTEETERTIFINGTIALVSPTYPLDEAGEEPITLSELMRLLSQHSSWRLLLPKEASSLQ